ncbi:MAG: hypothetical protein HQM13_17760 [SAR324 cluster bacterium]|nr:hypothetical protein [SAR324 cluster bacterium]
MEEVFLEIIKTLFACAGMLLTAIVMRPAVRFLKSPMPQLHALEADYSLEEANEEIQIPSGKSMENDFDPRSTLMIARKSPMLTVQTIRYWLKDSSHS